MERSMSSGRTCDPAGHLRWSSLFLKDCTPWGGPVLEQFMKDCLPWEGPHAGAGEQHEKEGVTDTNCYELSTICCAHPPVALGVGEEEVEESGTKE